MSKLNKTLSFLVVITFVISACNLPVAQPAGAQPPLGTPDYVATITAQAAALLQPLPGGQPNPSGQNQTPAAPAQILLTDTPASTSTITLTPSPTIPMVTVSLDTNCRTGPGKEYDYLGALLAGETAEVVGKNTETGYWIIKNPDGGICWLWGQYATVSGNTNGLQEYAIPTTPTPSPTPTLAPPKPPKNLTANKVCIPVPGPIFQYTGTLTWVDNADNEDGYNVYMNGGLFTSLPANSTVAPLPGIPFPPGTPLTMGVESFNAAGKSAMKTVVVVCP